MPANLDAIIKKLAKKVKIGEYDPMEVVEALNLTEPGWTIEPITTTMQASGYSNQKERFERLWAEALKLDVSSKHRTEFTDVPPDMEPIALHTDHLSIHWKEGNKLTPKQAEDQLKDVLAKLEKPLIKGKTLPSNLQVDGLYFAGFKKPDPGYRGASVDLIKPRLGVPGFLIKSPTGAELELPVQPTGRAGPGDPTKLAAAMIWTWLYKETDAPAKAAAYLENPETQARHGAQSRTKEIAEAGGAGNVGSCPICDRLQKLEKKRTRSGHPVMVHHGYKRPGTGYIYGDCFGVGYPPYELSAEGCEAYLVQLAEWIKRQKERVANIKARQEMECWLGMPESKYRPAEEYKLVTIHKNGRMEDQGEAPLTRDQARKMMGVGKDWNERQVQQKFWEGKKKGRNSRVVNADPGADPAAIFNKVQQADLKEAEGELRQMENDQAHFEKKIRDWTLQPLPGTTTASTRMDEVAEKLLAFTTPEKVRAAVEEAADLLAKLE